MTGLTTALAALSILMVGSTVTAKEIVLESTDIVDDLSAEKINLVFDSLLKQYITKIVKEGRTLLKIDGFSKITYTPIGYAALYVEEGLIGNFSTLNRKGDAYLKSIGPDKILYANLGVDDLKVEYNYGIYEIGSYNRRNDKGEIHVTVGTNSLSLKMKLETKPTCVISVQDWKIEKMDNINVDVTGLHSYKSIINQFKSWVTSTVIRNYNHYNTLLPELSEVMQKADLCNYKLN